MRTILTLATLLLVAIIALVVFKGLSATQPDMLEKIPVISSDTVAAFETNARQIGTILSWGVIAFAVVLQLTAWVAADRKIRSIRNSASPDAEKMQLLDNADIFFDLPLYFGLLGTVLSFILITVFPDAGLMFAYVSTALGIILSVFVRIRLFTPYRQSLILALNQSAAAEQQQPEA